MEAILKNMKNKVVNIKRLLLFITSIILTITVFVGCIKDTKDTNMKSDVINELTDSEDNKEIDELTAENIQNDADDQEEVIEDNNEKIEINVAALKGPTGMGMVKLMEEAEGGNLANNYQFTVAGEADVISTGLIKGEFDIAAVPCNLASVLYNKTNGQIKTAAINTLGVLYIVETGNTIRTVEDLKGKTIYSTGYGTTPQFTLNYLLGLYGIDPEKDLNIEYKAEATEVAAILENATDAIAMLPQPYVTAVMMNNDRVRIVLDIEKEWISQNDNSGVVTGVVVVNSEFLNNHPEAVEDFLAEYQQSAKFVNDNVDFAAELVEKFGIFKAAVAKKAIPYCNITFIKGMEMKEKVEGYLDVLYNQNPNAVGGAIPSEDFYYIP